MIWPVLKFESSSATEVRTDPTSLDKPVQYSTCLFQTGSSHCLLVYPELFIQPVIIHLLLINGLKLSQIFIYYKKPSFILCENTNWLLFPISIRIPSKWENFGMWAQYVYFQISSPKWHPPLLILWGAETSGSRVIYGQWGLSPPGHWF